MEFAPPSNLERYRLLSRNLPPDNGRLLKDGEWWGCPYWLVRDDAPPERAAAEDLSKVFILADQALALGSQPAEISNASCLEDGRVAFKVGAAPGMGADPRFLLFAEAVAEVEDWFYISNPEQGPTSHWLEGRRDGERVALVPPFRITKGSPSALSVPGEDSEEARG